MQDEPRLQDRERSRASVSTISGKRPGAAVELHPCDVSLRAMTWKPSCLIAAEDKPGKASAEAATQMFALLCYSCGHQFPRRPAYGTSQT